MMIVTYGFVSLCLIDWIIRLFQWIFQLEYMGVLNYFTYLFDLWQANGFMTIFMITFCLVGVPKFVVSSKILIRNLKKIIKSILKQPIIINVPISFYLCILFFKYRSFLPEIHQFNIINDKPSFVAIFISKWRTYLFSTVFTFSLFVLGIYSTINNLQVRSLIRQWFPVIKSGLQVVKRIFSTTTPTPMSMLILILMNTIVHVTPQIFSNIDKFLSIRVLILWSIILFGFYRVFRWLWISGKFEADLTGEIQLNDVSGLNQTRIHSVFYPRTLNDLDYLVWKAKSEGRTISIRGQAHTMGGQTLPSRKSSNRNYVCDLKYMNKVKYDEESSDVFVEAGATWTEVIKTLNEYGRSPVIMQSYCTFSVAGTISVNAHGITSDDAMYESVISIDYIDCEGRHGVCSRDHQAELFSLIIGGYGLFGIITRLRLKTVYNVKTDLEYIRLQSNKFANFYEKFLEDSSIEIKIARVDLARPNNILMFLFRRATNTDGTVADLSGDARVMNTRQHLMYTYLVQHRIFRRIRFALEKAFARPLDLIYSSDRNVTMYESAKPMALLYQPLAYYDDTFILQEYFVPKTNFLHWYDQIIPILKKKYAHIFLLNLTIRFVKKDQCTFLAYTKRDDCYAFVFYFRIQRNQSGDAEVQQVHQQLINITLKCDGTFYLPYRQHYSYEQIQRAYPMIDEFFAKKQIYDPIGLFSNDWYENYRPNSIPSVTNQSSFSSVTRTIVEKLDLTTERFENVCERRTDSFYRVMRTEKLRESFRLFLRTVFHAEPVHVMFHYVNRAIQNPDNLNDNDIYRDLQSTLKNRQFAFTRQIFSTFHQLKQLRIQILDMIRQQITIFNQLGCAGQIKNIVSIGDGGRCIRELQQVLKIKNGRVYLINDQQRWSDIIERGSFFPIGTFIPYDFNRLTDVPIPSNSIDLVVCYMGLHHLPQSQLKDFLKIIHRILRPNGLFLFREHHAVERLKPLLDVAHMVFNVVTGVSYENETTEIRAFRTIEQWRSCLREAGFQDTFVYNEQVDDPTDDIMMVFRKPAESKLITRNIQDIIENENFHQISGYFESNYFRPCEWLIVRMTMQFGQYLNHTPFYRFPYIKYLSIFWSLCWTETRLAISKYGWQTALTASPGFMMNIVVGTLLSAAFLQLSFFSFLVRAIPGTRILAEYEQLVLEEEIHSEENFDFQNLIDENIDHIQRSTINHLYSIRVPRHHVFTNILKKLALRAPNFILRSVSQQTEALQMELMIDGQDHECLLWLKQRAHIEMIFEFSNPTKETELHLFIRVDIPHLLPFIRDCESWERKNSLSFVQIFDHFD